MAASVDALAARVEDMTVEQVEEAAVRVTSKMGHVRGLEEITGVFDKTEIGVILATGVRKYHKYQSLKGRRDKKDIVSYRQLEKKFGANHIIAYVVCSQYIFRDPCKSEVKLINREDINIRPWNLIPGTTSLLVVVVN